MTILAEPVIAFASIMGRHRQAMGILKEMLDEIMTGKNKISLDDAGRLAELTMKRIGGENYAAT